MGSAGSQIQLPRGITFVSESTQEDLQDSSTGGGNVRNPNNINHKAPKRNRQLEEVGNNPRKKVSAPRRIISSAVSRDQSDATQEKKSIRSEDDRILTKFETQDFFYAGEVAGRKLPPIKQAEINTLSDVKQSSPGSFKNDNQNSSSTSLPQTKANEGKQKDETSSENKQYWCAACKRATKSTTVHATHKCRECKENLCNLCMKKHKEFGHRVIKFKSNPKQPTGDSGIHHLSPKQTPGNSGSYDLSPKQPPGNSESHDLSPKQPPSNTGSHDLSPKEPTDNSGSFDLSPKQLPGNSESHDLSPKQPPSNTGSHDLSPKEPPSNTGSHDLNPKEPTDNSGSFDLSPKQLPGNSESHDLSPKQPPSNTGSHDLSPKEPTDNSGSFDLSPKQPPGNSESHDLSPKQPPSNTGSHDLSPKEPPDKSGSFDLSPKQLPGNNESHELSLIQHPDNSGSHDLNNDLTLTNMKTTEPETIMHHRSSGKSGGTTTGIAILDSDHIVIGEFADSCVLIVHTNDLGITAKYDLTEEPLDVTVVHNQDIIVVSTGLSLYFLKVATSRATIFLRKSLKTDNFCRGIHYSDRKLFVCQPFSTPPELKILSMEGDILSSISNNKYGENLFTNPTYVTTNNSFIYVTDCSKVLQLTSVGELVKTYKHQLLGRPGGLCATEDGHLLVCCMATNNVHHIEANFSAGEVLIEKDKDGIEGLTSVAFCSKTKTVFVGCTSKDFIGYKIVFSGSSQVKQ